MRSPSEAPRFARALVFGAVLLCAACGLVYELALVALGTGLGLIVRDRGAAVHSGRR